MTEVRSSDAGTYQHSGESPKMGKETLPASTPEEGARLCIQYAARAGRRKHERRVVYVRFGTPPVTPVEVELMHVHLEACAGAQIRRAPNNDNTSNAEERIP